MTKYSLYIVVIWVYVFSSMSAFSQGEIIQEKDLNYYNENSFGVKLNSNGFGLDYRFEYRYTNKTRGFFESGFNYLKDPKEIKLYNPFFANQKKFIYGKVNSVFTLKAGTGIQKEIFSKQDKNSLSIRYNIAVGGILAFEKPMYYNIVDSMGTVGNQQVFYYSPKTIDINIHNPSDIVSKESYFMGFSETKITLGAYLRAGMSFEFSNDKYKSKAIEIGAEFDAYPKKVTIMAENGNNFFLNIYCAYRFGYKYSTVISRDARKFLRKQEKQ